MAKILLVEDDIAVGESLSALLEADKHVVDVVADGLTASDYLQSFDYDLIILDWQLPGRSGIEVCNLYRQGGGTAYVIMLTAQKLSSDKEMGLDNGADDYMTKPFEIGELRARIRALMRRPGAFTGDVLEAGALSIDTKGHVVRLGKDIVKLMPLEFSVLVFLARNAGQIFSATDLLNKVWSSEAEIATDSVYSCMNRLRKKLNSEEHQFIQTIHSVGYKFNKP